MIIKCKRCNEKLTLGRQLSITEMKALKDFCGSEQTHVLECKPCKNKLRGIEGK